VFETHGFELAAAGRELAWTEFGVREGAPIVVLHGSPGSGYDFEGVSETAVRKGVRLIAVDRPGYGLSTFDPVRS
jgi:pimeloyl-ACP methyl ester carboxylesterase